MRKLIILIMGLGVALAAALPTEAQQVSIVADCSMRIAQQNPGAAAGVTALTAVGTSALFDNRGAGCVNWTLVYSSYGFSAATIEVVDAPNNQESPGTPVAFQGTITTSGVTQPVSVSSSGTYNMTGYFPYMGVSLISKTGTGRVEGVLYGWKAGSFGSASVVGSCGGSSGYVAYSNGSGLGCDSGFEYNATAASPSVALVESDQAANGKWWATTASGGVLSRSVCSDTGTGCISYEAVTRSGLTVATVANSASTGFGFSTTGAIPTNFFEITSGTIPSTKNALTVTGTNSSTVATQNGAMIDITSATGHVNRSLYVILEAGATSANGQTAGLFENDASGQSTDAVTTGNVGVSGVALAATIGTNVGVRGNAQNGTRNVGAVGQATTNKNSAANIGGAFFGLNGGSSPTEVGVFAGLMGSEPTYVNTALLVDNGTEAQPIAIFRDNGTAVVTIADGGLTTFTNAITLNNNTINGGTSGSLTLNPFGSNPVAMTTGLTLVGKISAYNNATTAGWGVPAIYGVGQIAGTVNSRSAAVATYTVGAADGTFKVSGNINVTASSAFSFSLDVVYTDETNTSRTLILPIAQLAGTFVASGLATNITGTGPYESATMHIRCKTGTTITIRPSAGGTYTGVTYNVDAAIVQIA